jgi:hypothetical protein
MWTPYPVITEAVTPVGLAKSIFWSPAGQDRPPAVVLPDLRTSNKKPGFFRC